MALPPVASGFFNATSMDNNNSANSLALLVTATLTALFVGGSLICCRMKAHPLPGKAHPLPAYFELGQEAFQKGDFEKAVGHYENALAFKQVSSEKVYDARSRAYLEMKDYVAAWEDCKKALTKLQDARSPLDPPLDTNLSLQALCLKAELNLVQNQYQGAMKDCQEVLASKKADKKHLIQAHLILALAHYHSQNYYGAMEHCNKAISHNDDRALSTILLYNQAICYVKHNFIQNAHNSLEWAQQGLDELIFTSSHLRFALTLPSEWNVKVDTSLTPSLQLKQRIGEAFKRTKNPPVH